MPSIKNRAVLLNLGVFSADNNIRRNVGTFTHNFQCGENAFFTITRVLEPAETWVLTSQNALSQVTVVECTGQLEANLTLGVVPPVTNNASRSVPVTEAVIINQLLVTDDNVQTIEFSNPGVTPVRVTIMQG